MEIGAVSGSRILEMLEKIQQAGENPVSSGPSPIADSEAQELGRQFESLLDAPGAPESAVSPAAEPSSAAPESAGAAGTASEASVSPAELYSMQFQAAMLRFTAESGSQVQRQATQGLDSLLRNPS